MSEDRDPNQISLDVGLSSQVHRRIQMCPQSDHSWRHESLRQEVNKGARKHSPPGRIAFDVTDLKRRRWLNHNLDNGSGFFFRWVFI